MPHDVYCNVVGCGYRADGVLAEYGDFPVCALHDSPQTRGILEQLQRPHAYWCQERPIVLPCGALGETDLIQRPASESAASALECPHLAAVDLTAPCMVLPKYDLLSDRSAT